MLQQGLAGKLRIGAVPSALPIVSLITSPFAQSHPAVTVSVLSQTSIQIEAGLENFEIDVGVTYLDNEPLRHVRSLPLYQEDYILLMPADQAAASRRTIRWVEAAELPLCLLTPTMQNRRIIDGIFRSVGCSPHAGGRDRQHHQPVLACPLRPLVQRHAAGAAAPVRSTVPGPGRCAWSSRRRPAPSGW